LYAVLAVLVWFTLDEGKVFVLGKWVELRWFPLLILGGLALRTVLARQADRIRRRGEKGGSSTPGSL
jgi:nicotinic acid phosphoribosyltransferase